MTRRLARAMMLLAELARAPQQNERLMTYSEQGLANYPLEPITGPDTDDHGQPLTLVRLVAKLRGEGISCDLENTGGGCYLVSIPMEFDDLEITEEDSTYLICQAGETLAGPSLTLTDLHSQLAQLT